MIHNKKIACIGCGNMGRSLIKGLIDSGYERSLIQAADPDQAQRQAAADTCGISVTGENRPIIENAGIIILAVKPQITPQVLPPLRDLFDNPGRLLLSVAAGIRLHHLNNWLHPETPVIRAMPNMPALLQCGASGLSANRHVSQLQRRVAEKIMRSVGTAIWFENESDLDAVTALSGSGPAYFFLVMEAMESAGIAMGLTAEHSRQLTLATALGAARMAVASDTGPAILRRQVTSSGGVTERALDVLLAGDIGGLFKDALVAARLRAEELAKAIEQPPE